MAGLSSLNQTFYLLCILAFLERFQISYLTNVSEIYQKFFAIGLEQANIIISIPDLIIVGLSPVLAILFDRIGKRCFGLILGFIILLFANLTSMSGNC
jgi:hypothetical protein